MSLTEQIDELKKQQVVLDEKIKVEKENKLKENYTLERLEQLNKYQDESIKNYNGKYRGEFERQQTHLTTKPRFDVILEILKNQEVRIKELETMLYNKS